MLQFSVHQVKTIDPLRNWVQEWYQTENGSKSEHHMEGGGKSPLSLLFKSISPTPLLQMFHKSISPSRSISSSPHLSISSLLPTFFSWFLPPGFFRAIPPSSSFLFLRFAWLLAQNFQYIIHEVYSGSQRTVVWTNKMAGISADSVEPVLLFCDTFSHPENEVSVVSPFIYPPNLQNSIETVHIRRASLQIVRWKTSCGALSKPIIKGVCIQLFDCEALDHIRVYCSSWAKSERVLGKVKIA